MKRLSKQLKHCLDGNGCASCKNFEQKSVLTCRNLLKAAYKQIKEYEDLEERLRAVYGSCNGLLEKVVEHLERHEGVDLPSPVFRARLLTDAEVDRWEEYKDLEEQRKLLKLPVAVGDTVYAIYSDEDGSFVEEPKVEEVSTHRIWIDSVYFDYEDIGKTVFLTREAAEAALKEMRK